MEEILGFVPSEEAGGQQFVLGCDVVEEETVDCKEGDGERPRGETMLVVPKIAIDVTLMVLMVLRKKGKVMECPESERRSPPKTKLTICNAYASRIGFSVRGGGIRRNTKGLVRQRMFVRSKEGLKVDYGSFAMERGSKLETRTDCKACICLTMTDGVWEVSRFNPDHNLALAEPEQRKYLRSAQKLFEASPIISIGSSVVCDGGGIVRVPSMGMKVYSENEAYNMYNLYAAHIGFSIC